MAPHTYGRERAGLEHRAVDCRGSRRHDVVRQRRTGVSALSRGGWRRYATSDGLPANDVNTLFEDRRQLWVRHRGRTRVPPGGPVRGGPGRAPRAARLDPRHCGGRAGWLWSPARIASSAVNPRRSCAGASPTRTFTSTASQTVCLASEGVKRTEPWSRIRAGGSGSRSSAGCRSPIPARADHPGDASPHPHRGAFGRRPDRWLRGTRSASRRAAGVSRWRTRASACRCPSA